MSDEPPIRVTASIGGRRITMDPLRTFPLTHEIREVESLIPAGFRQMWVEGEGPEGIRLRVSSGAGWSPWLTFEIGAREFAVDIRDVLSALVDRVPPLLPCGCVADRWDPGLPPGGFVCSACGMPVESEPCAEHQPGHAEHVPT